MGRSPSQDAAHRSHPWLVSTEQVWGQVQQDLQPPASPTGNQVSQSKASVSPDRLPLTPYQQWPGSTPVETYFKVVLQEVVGFPEVLLVISIVETFTGRVIAKLPPLPIVNGLTLAPIITGIVHTLSLFLGQDVISKLKRQSASGREHWKSKESMKYPLADDVAGGLSSGFSNCFAEPQGSLNYLKGHFE